MIKKKKKKRLFNNILRTIRGDKSMDKKILILEELKRYAIDTAHRIRKLSTEKVDKQDGK